MFITIQKGVGGKGQKQHGYLGITTKASYEAGLGLEKGDAG